MASRGRGAAPRPTVCGHRGPVAPLPPTTAELPPPHPARRGSIPDESSARPHRARGQDSPYQLEAPASKRMPRTLARALRRRTAAHVSRFPGPAAEQRRDACAGALKSSRTASMEIWSAFGIELPTSFHQRGQIGVDSGVKLANADQRLAGFAELSRFGAERGPCRLAESRRRPPERRRPRTSTLGGLRLLSADRQETTLGAEPRELRPTARRWSAFASLTPKSTPIWPRWWKLVWNSIPNADRIPWRPSWRT